MAAPATTPPLPKFQANLNFNAIMSKMEQNVKTIGSAFINPKGSINKPKKPIRTTSTTKMRTYFGDEELLNTVPEAYYQEGFDPVTDILSKMPADFDDTYLDKLIEEKEGILEVLNGRLFTRVMSSYGAFVQGMTQIGELSGDLQSSTIMCKNGRRNLQVVKDQLTLGGFKILAKFRKRQNTALIVQDLLQIRSLLVFQQVLQKLLHVGDYPRTIATCLEARKTVARCSKYTVVRELDLGLQGVYSNVADRLDKALFEICRNFTPDNYEGLINAYKLLGSTSRIAEKLQSNFVDPIEADTKSIVLAHVLLSPENMPNVEQIKKKPFKDACAEVKVEHFMNCLLAILEFMCDLMFSHYAMSKWHTERQASEDNRGYTEIGAAMDRFKKTMWDAMQRQATLMITSTNLTSFKVEEFIKVVDAVSQFLDIGEVFSSTIALNGRNLLKSQAKLYLETFHKYRAEYLRTMLENETWAYCPVAPNYTVDDVKEFTESLSSSSTPSSLNSSISTSQTLSKIPKSDFGAIVTNGNPFSKMIQYSKRKAPAHAVAAAAQAQSNRSRAKSDSPKIAVRMGPNGLTGPNNALAAFNAGVLGRTRSNSANATNAINATNAVYATSKFDDDSSDEEPSELKADYIDEDTEGPAVGKKRIEPTISSNKGPLIAPTTISVVQLFAKYIHLLRVLHQSSLGLEVFVAAVQLVEYFIYTIFSLFGNPPPGSGMSQDDFLAGMTPPLRKMVARLKERLAPPTTPVLLSAVSLPDPRGDSSSNKTSTSAGAVGNSPHDLVKIKWTLVKLTPLQAAEVSTAKSGFGIGMRTVAVESLTFLADALTKAKPVLQALVPVTASEFFTTFYSNVGLIPELRMNMYKAAVSGLLTTETIGKSVENAKWDTSLVKVDTSDYVDKLLKEFVQFGQKLDKAVTLPPKVRTSLWEAAIMRGIEVVVDAYSKVKKCTNEGRANMMQDINALQSGIERVAPLRHQAQVPGISYALNYVNAFYLPLDDIPEWAQSHTEFSLRQVIALVNINPASATNRSKKQQIITALEELDKAKRK